MMRCLPLSSSAVRGAPPTPTDAPATWLAGAVVAPAEGLPEEPGLEVEQPAKPSRSRTAVATVTLFKRTLVSSHELAGRQYMDACAERRLSVVEPRIPTDGAPTE